MCTLSIVKIDETVIFTHNRDENIGRTPAQIPAWHTLNEKKVWYSKDPKGGGTWMATNGINIVCLLNGAFEKHEWNGPYRISRGIVVLDFIQCTNVESFYKTYNFDNIEPFTLFCYENKQIYKLVWNGTQIDFKIMEDSAFVWSSSTLYKKEIIDLRRKAFNIFVNKGDLNKETLIQFHTKTEIESEVNNLVMKRENGIETLCVMQFCIMPNNYEISYLDLINKTVLHV